MSMDEKVDSATDAPNPRETELRREIEILRKENQRQKALLARISNLVDLGLGEATSVESPKH